MGTNQYVISALAAMAFATYSTRAFPFLFLKKYRKNRHFQFVGLYLPPAVMMLLVIYCLKNVDFGAAPYGIAEFMSTAIVIALHLWKRNTLLSIGIGTICYVVLIRTQTIEFLLS